MFAQTWRSHWGLREDAFAHEDADKDPVLRRINAAAVHSSFDRIYGSPESPAPSVVFGEKGSGKSGLRLALGRRIEAHNEQNPEQKVFSIEYTEFDSFLDGVRQSQRLPAGEKAASKVVSKVTQADHLDAILSVGVSALTDEVLAAPKRPKKLSRKQRVDLLALASLYYRTDKRSRKEAVSELRRALRFRSSRVGMLTALKLFLTFVGLAIAALPHIPGDDAAQFTEGLSNQLFYGVGGGLVALTWIVAAWRSMGVTRLATRAVRSTRCLPRETEPLKLTLAALAPDMRRDLPLPSESEEATRYQLLQRLQGVLAAWGYSCVYVFIDRVDESTILAGREQLTQPFIERLLDHKLLQHPGVGFKIFLPIELSKISFGASSEDLKRMRLDKANTVEELLWTGQELYQVATERLRASLELAGGQSSFELSELISDDVSPMELREALHELGTPRHTFRFLSTLFSDYARNLPDDLDLDSDQWRVSKSHFDIVRASWTDKARVLRRVMN